MKDIVKVSIGRKAFSLEHEAYAKLNAYLMALGECFAGRSDEAEILQEVEERIATLLGENCAIDGVVDVKMVNEVIEILGDPKDFSQDEGKTEEQSTFSKDGETAKKSRRLMRDKVNSKIAGVCAGLAAYVDREPALIRFAFVVLQLLVFACDNMVVNLLPSILYLSLWGCMPVAKTSVQKAQMHGRGYGISDIMEEGPAPETKSSNGGSILRIIGILIGILLIFMGLSLLLGTIAIGTCALGIAAPVLAIPILGGIVGHLNGMVAVICGICILFLPALGMLYGGIMLTFNLRAPKWRPGLVIFLLWLISLIVGGFCIARASLAISKVGRVTDRTEYSLKGDTLRIVMNEPAIEYRNYDYVANREKYKAFLLGDKEAYSTPMITLRREQALSHNLRLKASCYSLTPLNTRPNFVDFRNDTLFVKTSRFGKGTNITDMDRTLTITVPDDATVLVDGPMSHDFKSYNSKSSFWILDR